MGSTCDLDITERYASAALFTLALHSTQVDNWVPSFIDVKLEKVKSGSSQAITAAWGCPAREEFPFTDLSDNVDRTTFWGWDSVRHKGLCQRVYRHLGVPERSWTALLNLPEVAGYPSQSVKGFVNLVRTYVALLDNTVAVAEPCSSDRPSLTRQITPKEILSPCSVGVPGDGAELPSLGSVALEDQAGAASVADDEGTSISPPFPVTLGLPGGQRDVDGPPAGMAQGAVQRQQNGTTAPPFPGEKNRSLGAKEAVDCFSSGGEEAESSFLREEGSSTPRSSRPPAAFLDRCFSMDELSEEERQASPQKERQASLQERSSQPQAADAGGDSGSTLFTNQPLSTHIMDCYSSPGSPASPAGSLDNLGRRPKGSSPGSGVPSGLPGGVPPAVARAGGPRLSNLAALFRYYTPLEDSRDMDDINFELEGDIAAAREAATGASSHSRQSGPEPTHSRAGSDDEGGSAALGDEEYLGTKMESNGLFEKHVAQAPTGLEAILEEVSHARKGGVDSSPEALGVIWELLTATLDVHEDDELDAVPGDIFGEAVDAAHQAQQAGMAGEVQRVHWYDARSRVAIRMVAEWLRVRWHHVLNLEALLATTYMVPQPGETRKTRHWTTSRALKVGAAAIAGGGLLALTGGLAAPAIAAGLGAAITIVGGTAAQVPPLPCLALRNTLNRRAIGRHHGPPPGDATQAAGSLLPLQFLDPPQA